MGGASWGVVVDAAACAAYDVDCRICGAPGGYLCRGPDGEEIALRHPERGTRGPAL